MSEKNNINDFDLMMKSILDEAQEAVPEHVWEGVSAGLDKAAQKKTVVLWWRRAAIGVAAAAAVILGVFFTYHDENELVPKATGEMVAVVETEEAEVNEVTLLANADEVVHVPSKEVHQVVPDSAAEAIEAVGTKVITEEDQIENEPVTAEKEIIVEEKDEEVEYFPEEWDDVSDEVKTKRGVSFSLSGLAGTNDAISQERLGMMMRPSVTPAPKKSGIEETSTKSSYGIPLSFGAGVKIDLSRRWSIGTGLNYTFLSRQFYGKYTEVSPEGDIKSVTSSDIRNRQHYIGIPVNAFFDVISNDRINFYAYAGGTVEKCLSDSYELLNTDIRHKEKVAGVQLSANAGIGVEFMLGKHLGLYIDPSVRYYFKNENQPKSIRTVQPLMLGFEMGLRARL